MAANGEGSVPGEAVSTRRASPLYFASHVKITYMDRMTCFVTYPETTPRWFGCDLANGPDLVSYVAYDPETGTMWEISEAEYNRALARERRQLGYKRLASFVRSGKPVEVAV